MALETLKDVKEIGGYPVKTKETYLKAPAMNGEEWERFENDHPIWIDHEKNTISFKIQSGPIKEVGVNGCQVDTIIEAAKLIIEGLNEKFPCAENYKAIQHLQTTLDYLAERTKNRTERGVEGTSHE